jgi:hypothetical protein
MDALLIAAGHAPGMAMIGVLILIVAIGGLAYYLPDRDRKRSRDDSERDRSSGA